MAVSKRKWKTEMPARLKELCRSMLAIVLPVVFWAAILVGSAAAAEALPSIDQVLAATTDILGEAAIRQPDGPSYEFFAEAMPPLRYVNAAFRHYPLVLAAPRNGCKARLVSNGSAINAKGGGAGWKDAGFPVEFFVGAAEAPFGEDLEKLHGPRFVDGYLPIVRMSYRDGETTYGQESFVSTEPALADRGVVFVRFSLEGQQGGKVAARVGAADALRWNDNQLCNERDQVLLRASSNWQWDPAQKTLSAALAAGEEAVLAVSTAPHLKPSAALPALAKDEYERQRRQCESTWNELLNQGAALQVPEDVVNNAWRALLVANLMIVTGNTVNYSAGNDYLHEYITEGSRTVGAFGFFGFLEQSRPMLLSLLDHSIPDHKYAVTGWKLQSLANDYWLTRDVTFLRENRHRWQPLIDLLLDSLDQSTGLLPKDYYASDIPQPVWNLKTNAQCWIGLRGLAAALRDMGEPDPRLEKRVANYRQSIIQAATKSVRHDFDPPFVPNALLEDAALDDVKDPRRPLSASRLGSYWCLVANEMLDSGVFDSQPKLTDWILDTLRRRGGVCMGMLRFDQHSGLFANERGVDDNYTVGYTLHLLKHDDVDHALVSLYGKLAQGLTHDTFVGGEGTSLVALDKYGRPMYLPPCTAGNAFFLWTLRHCLVQDWDTDDDSVPDTLRLLYAVPRRWLREGAVIKFDQAPTAFGKLSLETESRLSEGKLLVNVSLPPLRPKKTLLRARVPAGWKTVSAAVGEEPLAIDSTGAVDLSHETGRISLTFQVQQHPPVSRPPAPHQP